MTNGMTAYERVQAALRGEAVDRVPLCFWHHFRPEGSGERLAASTLEFFHEKFDLDIVKIMPDLPYPEPQQGVDQLNTQPHLGLDTPMFEQQLVAVRKLRAQLGDHPLILTLFSPLTYTFRWYGKEAALAALRQSPEPFMQGLATIASNLSDLMAAAIEAGASGIFFSCMGATNIDLKPEEYALYARPYDLQSLEGAREGWLNIVHVHAAPDQQGDQIYFDAFTDYPVSVMSWSDKLTGPSLQDALKLTDKALMGGLAERGPLTYGGEAEIGAEMQEAVAQIDGRRLILANGCSVPDDNPDQWLHVARRLVDTLRS